MAVDYNAAYRKSLMLHIYSYLSYFMCLSLRRYQVNFICPTNTAGWFSFPVQSFVDFCRWSLVKL